MEDCRSKEDCVLIFAKDLNFKSMASLADSIWDGIDKGKLIAMINSK
jgi:hypothetical protein